MMQGLHHFFNKKQKGNMLFESKWNVSKMIEYSKYESMAYILNQAFTIQIFK